MHPLWKELIERAGLPPSEDQFKLFERYLELLIQANERMNLTRITDPEKAKVLHIADALTLLPHLPTGPHRLADVGSGGGVPGMVLAIARPDARTTLIESTQKKAEFLAFASRELGLKNVDVSPGRAEDAPRNFYDVVTARAVGKMAALAGWMLPMLKKNGVMLAMKGPSHAAELPEMRPILSHFGAGAQSIIPAPLPDAEGHVIVKIVRVRQIG